MAHIICTVTNDLSFDRRMHRICRCLASAGHQVTLLGRQLPDSRPLGSHPFRQLRLACYFRRGKAFYLEFNLRLFAYLLRYPFDLVCAVDLDTLPAALGSSRLKGKACVYDAHEYFSEVPEVVGRPGVKRIWEWVARQAIPRVDAAYTVSASLADELSRRYHIPFAVIRNLPRQRKAIAPHRLQEPLVLLYQGALNVGRGLEATLEALRQLPDCRLLLAGEGDLSSALRQRARELGLEKKVHFLGWVEPADLGSLAEQATLGLNLLEHRGQSYYFSAANKAFDYIQAGLPSLQMDFPEYRRLQEQYGVFVLVHEASPRAIVEAVEALRQDPARYTRLATACRQAAEDLHWEKEAPKLLSLYKKLLP